MSVCTIATVCTQIHCNETIMHNIIICVVTPFKRYSQIAHMAVCTICT